MDNSEEILNNTGEVERDDKMDAETHVGDSDVKEDAGASENSEEDDKDNSKKNCEEEAEPSGGKVSREEDLSLEENMSEEKGEERKKAVGADETLSDKEEEEEESKDKVEKEEEAEDVVILSEELDSLKATVSDEVFFSEVSEEEKHYFEENLISPENIDTMKIQCTACWKQITQLTVNSIQRHPVLGVPMCRNCMMFYEAGEWEKDDDGSDIYCRWCGNGGEVLGCDECKVFVFCKRCITRNCGRAKFTDISEAEEWQCFSCEPSQIYKERNLMLSIYRYLLNKKTGKKDIPKKKEAQKVKLKEEKKKQKEEIQKQKLAAEMARIDNFIDENIHEAFDTLEIYQKCLSDERKKWIRARRAMTAENAASAVRNLRKIYTITKQNMELLDSSLVEGYNSIFPGESPRKLNFSSPPSTKKRVKKASGESAEDDIAVEEIVVNGKAVYANGSGAAEEFDPSMLCSVEMGSVEITRESNVKRPYKTKTPPMGRGPLRISHKFLKKKSPKKTGGFSLGVSGGQKRSAAPCPTWSGGRGKRRKEEDDVEEITLDGDDDDSVGYVSQSDFRRLSNDSDVSLE